MISYAMVGTNDLTRAKKFYDGIMQLLGARPGTWISESWAFYETGQGAKFAVTKPYDGLEASAGNGSMVAFEAPSRAAVSALYESALALGGHDDGAPGVRGANPDGFFMAYVRDLDGNKLCFVREGPAD